jgi:MFS family permease
MKGTPESRPTDAERPIQTPRTLALLAISWMFLYGAIGTGLVGPNRPAVEREFGLSHAQFGGAFALIQIVCSSGALVVSLRMRAFHRGSALSLSLLLQTVGFFRVFTSAAPQGLIFGWGLITLGAILGFVSNSLSQDLWPDSPRRGVLLLHGMDASGKVVGPLVAAICLSRGWRWSFFIAGTATFGLLLLSLFAQKRLPRRSAPSSSLQNDPVNRRHLFASGILPFALLTGANVSFATLVPTYCQAVFGMDARLASLFLGIHLSGMALGRFIFFHFHQCLSPNVVIRVCLATGLFIFLGFPGASLPLLGLSLFGVGGMFSGIWPTYYSQASRYFKSEPHLLDLGSALGGNLGSAACVLMSSLIAERSVFGSLVFGPAALWLFGLLYFSGPLSKSAPADVSSRRV